MTRSEGLARSDFLTNCETETYLLLAFAEIVEIFEMKSILMKTLERLRPFRSASPCRCWLSCRQETLSHASKTGAGNMPRSTALILRVRCLFHHSAFGVHSPSHSL